MLTTESVQVGGSSGYKQRVASESERERLLCMDVTSTCVCFVNGKCGLNSTVRATMAQPYQGNNHCVRVCSIA